MDPDRPERLREYRRRRDPNRTPEPFGAGGESPPASAAPRFVVQRHLARRLHYDLRLERDGVLESWALPRGLPWDPGGRHLAVRVEDHPLAYLDFQGEIPTGEYGAGRVQLWDRGTYELREEKADGGLSVRLEGARLRGIWELVPAALGGDVKNWLVIRKPEPGLTAVADDRPGPMLAVQVAEPPTGPEWAHEIKWDGFRCLARLHGGEPQLWSRNGQDLGERFAPISRRLARAVRATECVLDGEVCALDGAGRPDFGLLQRGGGRLVYHLFDLLAIDGLAVTGRPWSERRALLERLIEPDDPQIVLSPVFDDGSALLGAAREQRLEGVIAKRRESRYVAAGRSDSWRKVKLRERDRFTIVGHRRGEGARAALGALVLARDGDDGLRWVGNCGSGLGDEEIAALLERLAPLKRATSPLMEVPPALAADGAVTWVEPQLRCEVEFSELTEAGRLRAPVYLGRVGTAQDGRGGAGPPAAHAAAGPTADGVDRPAPPVAITRPERIYFPGEGITKGDLIAYYRAVAPALVPHLRDRPMSLMRMPHGIDGDHFVQKNRPDHMPDWIPTAALPGGTRPGARVIDFSLINEPEAIVWLVNAGCVDMNPWCSRAQHPTRPDWLLFDLDPAADSGFPEAARVALLVRDALAHLGLRAYPKTSSARGMHVMAPIAPVHEYREARELCKVVARALAATHPTLVTTTWAKEQRRGVLIDTNQVGYGRTISSVYSVRPRPGAPVSTPLTWDEVAAGVDPTTFTMRTVLERLERHGDLFAPVLGGEQLLAAARARLE